MCVLARLRDHHSPLQFLLLTIKYITNNHEPWCTWHRLYSLSGEWTSINECSECNVWLYPATSKSLADYPLVYYNHVLFTLLILISYYYLPPASNPCNASFLVVGAVREWFGSVEPCHAELLFQLPPDGVRSISCSCYLSRLHRPTSILPRLRHPSVPQPWAEPPIAFPWSPSSS